MSEDKKVYSEKEMKTWLKALHKEIPKHTETSKETLTILSKEYVKRWIIIMAFSVTFSLIFVVYNYTSKIDTELGVYKETVWETIDSTNDKISEMNVSIEGIETNIGWLINLFNNSEIEIE